MWSRPNGLKVFPYVEKCAKFENQNLKKKWFIFTVGMRESLHMGCYKSRKSVKMEVLLYLVTVSTFYIHWNTDFDIRQY